MTERESASLIGGGAAIDFGALFRRFSVEEERASFARLPLVDLDGVFAFFIFAGSLLIVELASYGAAVFCCALAGYFIARSDAVRNTLQRQWPFLIFPCFAMMSTLWSDAPFHTLKHSIEFTLTVVAGLLLASVKNPKSMLAGLFGAFTLYTLIALAIGSFVDVGETGTTALTGLNDSKNELSDMAASGFLVSAFMLWIGLRSGSFVQCLLAAAVGAVQLYATIAARSAGGTMGLGVAMAALAVLIGFRNASTSARSTVVVVGGTAALLGAVVLLLFSDDILSWLSLAFGKDETLTGRTYLWEHARELIAERPIAGTGFGAFWQQGNVEAEGLWRVAHIVNRGGFNFHNTVYDVLVDMGWSGLIIFGWTFVSGFWGAAASYVRKPSLLSCYWLGMSVFILVRTPFETIGIYEFYFSTVLLYAIFGSGAVEPLVIRVPERPVATQS